MEFQSLDPKSDVIRTWGVPTGLAAHVNIHFVFDEVNIVWGWGVGVGAVFEVQMRYTSFSLFYLASWTPTYFLMFFYSTTEERKARLGTEKACYPPASLRCLGDRLYSWAWASLLPLGGQYSSAPMRGCSPTRC